MKMKLSTWLLTVVIVVTAYAEGESFAAKMAGVFGAKAKVVLRVVDDEGNPVEGARVGVGFYMNKKVGENPTASAIADKTGMCEIKGRTVSALRYSVKKDGCYKTKGRLWFAGSVEKPAIVKWGKWQPYGATNNVVLKPIKNSVKMIYHEFEKKHGDKQSCRI